jgi:hypothetical protein
MKKLLIVPILLLFTMSIAFSTNTFFQIKLKNGVGQEWNNLIFGVSDSATSNMDLHLNEKEIPNFPFPNDVFTAVALTYDSTEQRDIWSYRSIFGITQDSTVFMVRYRFRLFFGGSNTVTMKWANLDKHISSAYLVDKWGGNWLNVNMKQQDSAVISEILVDHFDVVVVYDYSGSSVAAFEDSNISLYPNPSNDYTIINSDNLIKSIEICNILGEILSYTIINDNFAKIKLADFDSGVYFARIIDNNCNISVRKIIKN